MYLTKLPRLEKKVRVAIDWTLDMFFSKDLVQLSGPTERALERAMERASEEREPVAA